MSTFNSVDTSISRRNAIKTLGAAPFGILALTDDDCECECGGLLEGKTQTQSVQEPAFHVTGVDENGDDARFPVYWKSESAFKNQGYKWAIALAWNRGDIWLNEGMKDRVSPAVIAHEYGHCIGYDHIDGTIMGAGPFKMDDAAVDVALTNTTTDIVDRMDNVEIIDWSNDDSITKLGDIASQYAKGKTDIVTLGKAAKRYVNKKSGTVWFGTTWDQEAATKHQFYSQSV